MVPTRPHGTPMDQTERIGTNARWRCGKFARTRGAARRRGQADTRDNKAIGSVFQSSATG
jgi:hypothetical protein